MAPWALKLCNVQCKCGTHRSTAIRTHHPACWALAWECGLQLLVVLAVAPSSMLAAISHGLTSHRGHRATERHGHFATPPCPPPPPPCLQGKSTLTNYLLGDERCLTGPEPGLTRDAIKTRFEFKVRFKLGWPHCVPAFSACRGCWVATWALHCPLYYM